MRWFPVLLAVLAPLLPAAEPVVVPVPYTVDRDARVSLALYDTAGRMVRTLLTGAPRQPGSYVASWDGRDRYGNPLPAGTYTWRRAISGGLQAEFICQIGQNPDPTWESGVGNHSGPGAIAIDETGVYLVSNFDEGTHAAVKTDFQGRYLWTSDPWWANPWAERGASATIIGGNLFRLAGDGTVYGHRSHSGRIFTNDTFQPNPWNLRWADDAEVINYVPTVGMDLDGDRAGNLLVASYRARDGIAWFSAVNGSPVDTAAVPAPVAVAVAANGTVYAISQGAVVSLSRTNKTPHTVIPATALVAPWRLSIDPSTGDIVVAENSARAGGDTIRHQIKKFTAAGVLIRTYGRPDGRQQGTYVAADVRGVIDIAADGQGGFLITEGLEAPRRSVWMAASGTVQREWFGGQAYGLAAVPEPGDPTHVWYGANGSGLVRCRIDLVAKTARVIETYTTDITRSLLGGWGRINRSFQYGGRIYLVSGAHDTLWLGIYDPISKRVRVCNVSGPAFKDNQWHIPASLRPTDGSRPYSFRWNDLNDDGIATPNEISWSSMVGGWVDPATLTLWTSPMGTAYNPGPRLVPTAITAGGTPIYPSGSGTPLPRWTEQPGEHYFAADYRRDASGNLYGVFSDSFPGWENHGVWYFNSNSGIDRLVKWNSSGQQVWSVGRHSPDPDSAIGSQAMPRSLAGMAHGYLVWADCSDAEYIGSSVWTEHGLWVGEIPKHPADRSNEWILNANGNEYASFNIMTDADTGEVLFFGQTAMGGAPVYRITGWNSIVTASGTVVLPSAPPALAMTGTGLSATYFNNTDVSGSPALSRIDEEVWFNWANGSPGSGVDSDHFSARWTGQVLARYSGETRFTVEGNRPWQDGGDPHWVKLWVDGRLLIDGRVGGWEDGRILLQAGQRYDIVLETAFTTGGAAIHLCWEHEELDRRRIERRYLFPTGSAGPRHPGALVAHWRLDETSGTTAASATVAAHPLQLIETQWQGGGVIGGALSFAGGNAAGGAAVPVPAAASTVSLWFRTTAANGGLWSQVDNGSGSDRHLYLADGAVVARLADGSVETIRTAEQDWNDDTWHHLVHVVGGPEGGQRLYIDGFLRAAGTVGRSGLSAQSGIRIGRSALAPVPSFTGLIDEVRLYSQALGARAIHDDLYRREVGLIAYFPCDEGSGHRAHSTVGAQIWGNLSGQVTWTQGKFGGALALHPDGPFAPALVHVDHEIRVPATDLTVAFWVKTTAAIDTLDLFCVDRDSSYNNRWVTNRIWLHQGRPRVREANGHQLESPLMIADGAWHHIATTIGGTSGPMKLYVNGILQATGTTTANPVSTRLGIDLDPQAAVSYDELRVYGRALTASEILTMSQVIPATGSPPAVPPLPVITGNGSAAPVVTGTGTIGTSINVMLDGTVVASVPVVSDGTWTHTFVHLPAGTQALTISATNAAGTSAPTAAQTLTIGTGVVTPPAVIVPPTPAAPTVSGAPNQPTLTGTTTPGATVRIRHNGEEVAVITADGSGAWTWTAPAALTTGEHAFTVVAENAAGSSAASLPTVVTIPTSATDGEPVAGSTEEASSQPCGFGLALLLIALFCGLFGIRSQGRSRLGR